MKSNIELNEYIFGDAPCKGGAALFVGRIVEVREKAVKVDYAIEPIFVGSAGSSVTVFTYSVWMPKSVILNDERGSLTTKKWFMQRGLSGAHHIKKYFMSDGKKVLV